MRHSFNSIKKISLALGVAGISVLVGVPAWAQSSGSSEAPEFKLSNEGMKILCTVTPLNSRCEGSPYYSAGASSQPLQNDASTSPSGTTAPTQNLPSESDVPSSQGQPSGGMMQGSPSPGMMQNEPSGSNGTMTSPSGTTAPTQNLPSETDETSPQGQPPGGMQGGSSPNSNGTMTPSSGGMVTPPVQNLPNSGSQDGGTPSGSNGTMTSPSGTSPSGTTAPTQNLPSESPGK